MTTSTNKKSEISSFEEILKLFTELDSPEKTAFFKEKFSIFLTSKSVKERKFIGSIMLTITKENAHQVLNSIKQRKDIDLLNQLEKALKEIK